MTVKVFYENKTDPTKSFSQKFEDVDRIEEVEQVIDHQDEFADHHEYVYYNYDLFNENGTQVSITPVRFLLFVNRIKDFPESYLSYIKNLMRKELG